jgi:hypothetical protein
MKCPHPNCTAPKASAPRREHVEGCPRRASRGGKTSKTRAVRLEARFADVAERFQREGRAEEAANILEPIAPNKH